MDNINTVIQEQKTGGFSFLNAYEKVFSGFLVFIAAFHLVCAALQYAINMEFIKLMEPKTAWVLAAGVIFYIIISVIRYPWNLKRIRNFFSRMCTYEQIYLIFVGVWFAVSIVVHDQKINGLYYY